MRFNLLLVFLALVPAITMGANITVGPQGYDYSSIQAAVNAADPGDTVEVYGGTYSENVFVNKTLVLKGIDMPVVDAMNRSSAIALRADGITLEGFVFTNASANEAGILVYSSQNAIVDNLALSNPTGIYLLGSDNNTISRNNASYNEEEGIRIASMSNGNMITENVLSHNGDGLAVSRSQTNTIAANTLSQNEYGILLFESNDNTIYNNNLVGNGRDAWDYNGTNQWDDGSRGNYYSDFDCLDSDDDSICDSAYQISEGSVDRYPLATSFS